MVGRVYFVGRRVLLFVGAEHEIAGRDYSLVRPLHFSVAAGSFADVEAKAFGDAIRISVDAPVLLVLAPAFLVLAPVCWCSRVCFGARACFQGSRQVDRLETLRL